MTRLRFFGLIATLLGVAATSSAQITNGQVDDFQDGTLQNWGGGASLQNIANGGPSGAGDRFLQVQSFGGIGGGSRLATLNDAQWTGNYQAAGVTSISLFMRNLGQTNLEIRAVLFDLTGTDERWTSTVSQSLNTGGTWQFMTFSLSVSALTRVQGTGSYSNLMADVDRLMFRHQAGAPAAEGSAIAAIAGMDNIRAVPEPASLLALGLGALFMRRRKR